MTVKQTLVLILVLLSLAGCGKPVPIYKASYIGEWQAPTMYLRINPDGGVVCRRVTETGTVSVKGPLQGFRGDDFIVGYGFFTTTFKVDIPPYLNEDATWRMVVDGVELLRTRRLGPAGKGGIMV